MDDSASVRSADFGDFGDLKISRLTIGAHDSNAPQVLTLLALLVQKVQMLTRQAHDSNAPQVLTLLALLVQKSTNADASVARQQRAAGIGLGDLREREREREGEGEREREGERGERERERNKWRRGACVYSLYSLYWYKSTNTGAKCEY